jgi:heme exporter protein D
VTHLPYIVVAYAIAVGLPLALSIDALLRTRSARRRLAAIDPRRDRGAVDSNRDRRRP